MFLRYFVLRSLLLFFENYRLTKLFSLRHIVCGTQITDTNYLFRLARSAYFKFYIFLHVAFKIIWIRYKLFKNVFASRNYFVTIIMDKFCMRSVLI